MKINECLSINFGRFSIELQVLSPSGCLLLPFLFLLFAGGIIFLNVKIFSIVFPIIVTRLGITFGVGIALLIAMALGSQFNIPLYLVAVWHSHVRYELFPIWLLRFKDPVYRRWFQPHTFVGINVAGALIPLVLALYQFSRTPPPVILAVTTIVAVVSYFSVKVVPGTGIYCRYLWLVAIIAALSALRLAATGTNRADVSVAFAGGVLGTVIGADLLHLKDIQPEKAKIPLSIGGAGLNDGIALCGLYSLLIAEWMPKLSAFVKM